jgi:hypothetical protein
MKARNRTRTAWPLLAAVLLVCACRPAWAVDLEALHSATARLRAADGGTGTGTAFERSQGHVFLLTCAHVATGQAIAVEWFYRGHQSAAFSGAVIYRDEASDVAVVSVPESALGGVLPPVIPLAEPGHAVRQGAPVYTVGSANGVWPTGFEGHALGYDQTDLRFLPPPQNGRSGSALVDSTGVIVGVVRARSNKDGGDGIATPVQAVYRLWGTSKQREIAAAVAVPWRPATPVQAQRFRYQLPLPGVQRRQYQDGFQDGTQCGPDGCPIQPQQQAGPLGGAIGNLWPTLPQQQQAAPQGNVAPQVAPQALDLQPLADAIRGPPEEAELRKRALKAEAEYYEGLAGRQEQDRQQQIADALPLNSISGAAGSAVQGDWSGAGASITGPEVGAWAAGGIAALLAGFFGLRGVFAVLLKFAIAAAVKMGFSYVHGRITAPERTEVDEVIDDVKKPSGATA